MINLNLKKSILVVFGILSIAISGFAQETDAVVVDEVVAQVNDSVILLSQINREIKNATDAFVQQGKSEAESKALVEGQRGQLMANLINEELMLQRGKDMGLEKTVDEKINIRLLELMQQFKLSSIDALYESMRQQGVDPEVLKQSWKKEIMREEVFRNMVDGPTYWGLSEKELKEFYEKNKAKFNTPATVTISEIFMSYAGKDPEAVRTKAKELVTQINAGGDFEALAIANSDRPDVENTRGKAGKFILPDVDPKFVKAMEGVAIGKVTEPIEVENGIEIIRIDGREEGSTESAYNESIVRATLLEQKLPEARIKFLGELFDDAYVKIRESYKDAILPFLKPDIKPTEKQSASK